jgi:predicted molibdopterin-dependent oxidoreductase YjgC
MGACGLCLVEYNGKIVSSCTLKAEDGMEIRSKGEKVEARRELALKLLLAAHPEASQGDGENEMDQCEYCGEWFSAGSDFRNHMLAAHPEASQGDGENE